MILKDFSILSLRGLTIITSVYQGIKVDWDFRFDRWSVEKALNMLTVVPLIWRNTACRKKSHLLWDLKSLDLKQAKWRLYNIGNIWFWNIFFNKKYRTYTFSSFNIRLDSFLDIGKIVIHIYSPFLYCFWAFKNFLFLTIKFLLPFSSTHPLYASSYLSAILWYWGYLQYLCKAFF